MLWIGSLGLTVMATRALLRPISLEESGSLADPQEVAESSHRMKQGEPTSKESVVAATRDALREPDPLNRVAGLAEILPHLNAGNALDVLDAYRDLLEDKGHGRDTAGELILLQVGRTAGLAALERDRPRDPASPRVPSGFDGVMRGFAGTDPSGALQYWRSLPDGP